MFHRSTARLAGAVILGAGLMLGTAAPALAQETGPESQACVEATQERDGHQELAAQYRAQADEFEAMAQQHDSAAAEADELATARQDQAADKDALATAQQTAAAEFDAEATTQQQNAAEFDAAGMPDKRDAARAAAAEARDNRDAARDRAEGARQARDDARASAEDARAEREAQRSEATKDRERRDARLAQVEREQNRAAAVDMSVCDEPPADGHPKPPGDKPEPEPKPDADLDCADFPRADGTTAQNVLDGDGSDPHRLDADRDGKACEVDEQEDTEPCPNAGMIHDSGDWAWNCEQWIPVDTDDAAASQGGVETGDGGTEKLAYTGAGNALGWLAGGLGLVGAGALVMAAGPRLLRRS